MAKETEFRYGSAAVPDGEAKYSVIRWRWDGLNRTDKIDTGQLTDASGVLSDPPYLYPKKEAHEWPNMDYDEPISIHGFDDNLLVIYRDGAKIKADLCRYSLDPVTRRPWTYKNVREIGDAEGNMADFQPRSAVQFNHVDTSSGNVATYTYDRRILVFPDAWAMPYDYAVGGNIGKFRTAENPVPGIRVATVYGSRVFGLDDNNVYASVYNNYADWSLDTADSVSADHAWMSMSQSNSAADGTFTAITTYDNHPVLFKKDFMQLVYNNKNPFRIVDVGSFGCDNPFAVAEMGGVLYFASQDKVYAFTGGTPKEISKKLDLDSYAGAVLGAYKDKLYMYVGDQLWSFSGGVWSCLGPVTVGGHEVRIRQFAAMDYGLCALVDEGDGSGRMVFVDWSDEMLLDLTGDTWENEYAGDWWFETDFMALGRLDIRRVKKVSVLCEGEAGAALRAYLLRDGEKFDPDTAEPVGELEFIEDGQKILRVLTRQFSGYLHRLRIAGSGYAKLYAVELKISWGGDVYAEG